MRYQHNPHCYTCHGTGEWIDIMSYPHRCHCGEWVTDTEPETDDTMFPDQTDMHDIYCSCHECQQ